jgi:serine/threonine protein kinase
MSPKPAEPAGFIGLRSDGTSYVTTPPVKTMRPQVGQLINNKYRLTRLLGDGGMGSVFEAQHEVLGKAVALKFLHPELARRQGLVQRFLQEARVSAKIDSRHVVKVTDVEQTPTGLPFMVMELLKGKSLQALYEDNYRDGKRLAYEDALKYSSQMLDGLEAAHDEGVVHRDLKPDNVMIVEGKKGEPYVKLLDFGIAKLKINGELYKGLTRPGVIMGTPEYMAPEQVFSADAVDARADIFSCGVIFFEMLAGRRPVGGDEAHQIAAAYLSGNIAKLLDLAPHVPPGLADIVHKAMAPDPKERFASVADFKTAMEPFTKDLAKVSLTTAPPNVTPAISDVAPKPSQEPAGHAAASSKAADLGPEFAGTVAAKSPDGWSVDGAAVSSKPDGAATDKVSHPYIGDDIAAISAKLQAAAGHPKEAPKFDSTVEGQPFFPGSTAAYKPPADAKPASVPPPGSRVAGVVRPGGTDIDKAAPLPATASYDAAAPIASYPMVQTPVYAAPRKRRRSGIGFGSILLIGSVVAGAVVAGVYAYEQSGKHKTKDDTKTVALPTKSATTTEPVTQTSVVSVAPDPQPTYTPPTVATTQTSPRPTTPGPRPTGPKPSASNTSIIPTVIIPSTWPPFDLPIPGMGTSTTKKPEDEPKKPGKPKLEPIPHGALEPIQSAIPIQTEPQKPKAEPSKQADSRPTLKLPRPKASTPRSETASKPESKTVHGRVVPVGKKILAPKR